MAPKPRVVIDLNVILDVLQRREPFYALSAGVLASAETGRFDGWVAAHSLTTLFYLIAKYESAEQARLTLSQLLSFLKVAAVDQEVIEQALVLPAPDFEDAVQMAAAVRAGAECVVTRDPQGFKHGPLPALSPAELLAVVE